ncbi:EamA family transporter [Halalkalibacter krulwichiae]|uniref:EamA-like transporter family protein n=1 Tax=Halalkalibacter krulwichiae TaxID=199441 RepID=A0A1X9M7P6_9BACI|nr:DMT family transporter [Halalkalibacter krulwichiae]ARK29465.1 EamA-like transporter family protein [Halalkalibacter krulwichiae]
MKKWHYALIVLAGGCCYGILSTFVKLAYSVGFSLTEVVGGQFIIGTICISLLALFSKRIRLTVREKLLIATAGVPMGLTGIFYYQSLQSLDASLAIIFLFQFIWIGSFLEWLMENKGPSNQKLLSIFILLLGSICAAGLLTREISFNAVGAGWGLGAALMFAVFIYCSGTVCRHVPPIQKSAWLAYGGLVIVMLILPPIFLVEQLVIVELVPYVFVLGLFGVALPPLLFSIGMPHVGAGLGTILSASELPVAIILSAFVLRESVDYMQWTGVLMILIGIAIGNKTRSEKNHHSRKGESDVGF